MNIHIEDDINFFNEITDFNNNTISYNEIDESKCLISGTKLEKNFIKLECNHTFNYIPLLKSTYNQKKTYNSNCKQLKVYELQCPYCRNIQDKILPFRKFEDNKIKIYGVTCPKKYCMNNLSCQYIFNKGKNKNRMCNKESSCDFCTTHLKIINKRNLQNKFNLETN